MPMKAIYHSWKNSLIGLSYIYYSVTASSETASSAPSDDATSISIGYDAKADGSSCSGSEDSTFSSVDSVEGACS